MHSRRALVSLLFACASMAGCSQKPPPPENKAVLDAFEAALFMPDPDLDALLLDAAWLGPEALPPAVKVWPMAAANDQKRIKLARFLEVMAWNGFRTTDSVKVLAGAMKDRQPQVRKSAINGLFASAADFKSLDSYWDPADCRPGHEKNPSVTLRLPFAKCRELLAKRGIAIAKNADGSVAGDPGRTHAEQPAVPMAAQALRRWWTVESDVSLKIYSAIQAARTGDKAALEPLVSILRPLPEGAKPNASLDAARACSLRALQEATGQQFSTHEQWEAWWEKNRPAVQKPQSLPPRPPGTPK